MIYDLALMHNVSIAAENNLDNLDNDGSVRGMKRLLLHAL